MRRWQPSISRATHSIPSGITRSHRECRLEAIVFARRLTPVTGGAIGPHDTASCFSYGKSCDGAQQNDALHDRAEPRMRRQNLDTVADDGSHPVMVPRSDKTL